MVIFMARLKERIVSVDEILKTVEPKEKETIQNLRALIKTVVPQTVELIKHKNIVYKLGDKDFVWISHYQGHVDLEFSMGASLDSNLLRSKGKEKSNNTRHVPVGNFDKLKPEIIRLLKSAAAVGFEHC
jgi:hypothetical protein